MGEKHTQKSKDSGVLTPSRLSPGLQPTLRQKWQCPSEHSLCPHWEKKCLWEAPQYTSWLRACCSDILKGNPNLTAHQSNPLSDCYRAGMQGPLTSFISHIFIESPEKAQQWLNHQEWTEHPSPPLWDLHSNRGHWQTNIFQVEWWWISGSSEKWVRDGGFRGKRSMAAD